MDRPYSIRHQYKYRILASLVFIGLAGFSTPEATAQQSLFVGNDNTPGGVQQYTLPISGSSTPNFTVVSNNVVAMGLDASGNMAVGDNAGHLQFFTAPLSGASIPSAAFANGVATNGGGIVFTPAGDFFAATVGVSGVNMFTHPFSNASTPSMTISNAGLTSPIGLALDGAQNLYIGNAGGGGSNLFVYAPPYTGVPIITPAVAGTAYRKVALSATQLFAASVVGVTGRVDVYTLPITAASAPAFSITTGVNTPEAVVLDAGGNLYIGNLSTATVGVYNPPFSAASAPSTTLTIPGSFSLFGTAIGTSVSGPSVPAIGREGLVALCALLLVLGLIATRAKT
jgi:hypothetical protein